MTFRGVGPSVVPDGAEQPAPDADPGSIRDLGPPGPAAQGPGSPAGVRGDEKGGRGGPQAGGGSPAGRSVAILHEPQPGAVGRGP